MTTPLHVETRALRRWAALSLILGIACQSPTASDFPDLAWTHRDSRFGSAAIVGAAYGAGRFVIVGEGGRIATSEDGETWTPRGSTFGDSNIRSVTFANNTFVAVGADRFQQRRTISTSPDGITWTLQVSARPETLRGIAYGNGVWVAVGDHGVVQRSTNLVDWEDSGPLGDAIWISATYANGRFIITGGRETVAWSLDGTPGSWTISQVGDVAEGCSLGPDCSDIDDLCFTGVHFVAVTHPNADVLISSDLTRWHRSRPAFVTGPTGFWVADYAPGLTLVGGGNGTLAVSRDHGLTWEQSDAGFDSDGIIAMTASSDLVIIGGLNGKLATSRLPARRT